MAVASVRRRLCAPCRPTPLAKQTEAVHLFLSMLADTKVQLPPAECRDLLQQVCHTCQAPPAGPASIAAGELVCGCLDLLAQLPQWYPKTPKPELAAAVTAVTAVLERYAISMLPNASTWRSGWGGSGGMPGIAEAPATTRLLCKLLKALQVLLAEVG